MRFTSFLTSFLLLFIFLGIDAQHDLKAQHILKGRVVTEKGSGLDIVTIAREDGIGTISNYYGKFRLPISSNKESVKIQLRRLGYETLDTVIKLSGDSTEVEIALKEMVYRQPEVEILADRFNIFHKNNWKVFDYMIYKDYFIFLYRMKGKKLLGLFDSNGFLIHKQKVSAESYKRIERSCTGSILLIGRWDCGEYFLDDEKIYLLKYHGTKKYEKMLEPCFAKINNELYFKNFTNHNKRINYYTIPTPRRKKLLYMVEDSVAAHVANVYYQDILIAYTNFARGNYSDIRQNHYDYVSGDDITRPHIINDGLWDGDLQKLAVDAITEGLIDQYLLLESKPITSGDFVKDSSIYVINYAEQSFIQIDGIAQEVRPLTLSDYPWETPNKILQDQATDSVYILSLQKDGRLILHQLAKDSFGYASKKLMAVKMGGERRTSLYVHRGRLYYLAHYQGRNSQLKWVEIENPEVAAN